MVTQAVGRGERPWRRRGRGGLAMALLAGWTVACAPTTQQQDIRDIRVSEANQAVLYERIQRGSELKGEEIRLLESCMRRHGLEDRLPIGRTVGELVAEQRGFESRGGVVAEASVPPAAFEAAKAEPPAPAVPAAPQPSVPPRPPATPVRKPPPPAVTTPAATPTPDADLAATTLEPAPARPAPEPTPKPPSRKVLPSGTILNVRLEQALSSKTGKVGDTFKATSAEDVIVDGRLVAPRGSPMLGQVTQARPSGKLKGLAQLTLGLVELQAGGQTYPLKVGTLTFEARPTTKDDAKKVGLGAGAGAVIGAITGGRKGAAIGAAAGAAAGAGVVLATSGQEVDLPVEQVLAFQLEADLEMKVIGK